MAKIKFACKCGKALSAEETSGGKNARCPQCAQIVRIPLASSAPGHAVPGTGQPVPPPAAKGPSSGPRNPQPPLHSDNKNNKSLPPLTAGSLWDEDLESEAAGSQVSTPLAAPAAEQAPARKKAAQRPWWIYWAVFFVYLAIVWLVSRSSPIGSMLLVMPVFFLGVMIFMIGGVWYFLVIARDEPGQAATLFFALLKSFLTGGSATGAGYRMGKENRGKPANPAHARPIRIMKAGALVFAYSIGATLIVGILLGTWTKENLRDARFRELENMSKQYQRSEPQLPSRFR